MRGSLLAGPFRATKTCILLDSRRSPGFMPHSQSNVTDCASVSCVLHLCPAHSGHLLVLVTLAFTSPEANHPEPCIMKFTQISVPFLGKFRTSK